MNCDKKQEQIVLNDKDNILLYAGAGTGKTFTIGKKIAHHVNEGLCSPSQILCLTFTVKASKEMAEDIEKSIGEKASEVTVKTLHGFCYKIISEESVLLNENFIFPQIIDEVDTENILRDKILPLLNVKAFSKQLKARGATRGYDWLKTRDVFYNQNNKLFYYITENNGKYFLINQFGNSITFLNSDFLKSSSGAECPECGSIQLNQGNICERCGYDFREIIYPFKTSIPNLRNFVSYIKRQRALLNLFTLNDEQDYQNTFNFLYQTEQDKIEKFLCYKDVVYNKNIVDQNFLECMRTFCGYFISEYDKYLYQTNSLDFDDLIIKTLQIFDDYNRLSKYAKYSLIVIDEMQDTSLLEYSVIKRLFNCQVIMCGDLNQSIYRWRGAEPTEILTSFKEEYNALEFFLENNYRSTEQLCSFADNFRKNAFSDEVKVTSCKGDKGVAPLIFGVESFASEAKFVYDKSKQLLGTTAVLARTNAYAKNFYSEVTKFSQNEKVFISPEEEISLNKSPLIKTLICLLKIIVNPEDKNSLERVCLEVLGLGAEKLKSLNLGALGLDLTAYLKRFVYEDKDCFEDLLSNTEIIVYDIETSSLDKQNCEIIQISALNLSNNQIFNKFIKPQKQLDQASVAVHGYSQEFLEKNGEDLFKTITEFTDFCNGKIIVGHNSNNFDLPIIKRVCSELNIKFNYFSNYDTLSLAKILVTGVKNYKLETLCNRFSIINERAHDAMSDVTATAHVLNKFIKDLKITQVIRKNVLKRNKSLFENFYIIYSQILSGNYSLEELLNKMVKDFNLLYKSEKRGEINYARKIDRLKEKILTFDNGNVFETLTRFLDNLNDGSVSSFTVKKDQIPILTIHQAKGMEFDNVFLVGVDNFTFPDGNLGKDNEQRRIFYVAITRPKKRLFITYSEKNKFNKQNFPSELLKLIKND